MTAPPVYPRGDQYPPLGDWTTVRGVISSDYLERDQQMIVRWSTFWEAMTEAGYVRPVDEALNPDVEARFPTVGDVMDMIRYGATTLPGERILGVRAEDARLIIRVGVTEETSREASVDWPGMDEIVSEVAGLRDETEVFASDARAGFAAAVAGLRDDLVNYNAIASAAAKVSLDAAEGKVGHTGWVELPFVDGTFSGQILVRRRGNDVDARFVALATTVERTGSTVVSSILAGFRPIARVVEEITASTSLADIYRVWAEGSNLRILGGSSTVTAWPVDSVLVGSVSWVTDDPWPED